MKLTYHTRGNAAPQGKPRVYFTGHPADLEPYSKDIFSDILSTQNCAVYYDREPDAPFDQEELLRTLEEMQLIVIPVTSRFLYLPNRARELELPFAMERHIPVLPLMQEQGQEAAFNEKCGDLQLLSKHDENPAVIPYPEKLQRFLDSVLMGDSLAARVRAAFQAYIFLSYRKKDRKYAHELMKLIHQNEFCRDVAIWYDEFLTPAGPASPSCRWRWSPRTGRHWPPASPESPRPWNGWWICTSGGTACPDPTAPPSNGRSGWRTGGRRSMNRTKPGRTP